MFIVEIQRLHFRLYLKSSRSTVYSSSVPTEGMHAENHRESSDLRHLVANVAHDLKTPLSSFMVGIELIQHNVENLLEKSLQPGHHVSFSPSPTSPTSPHTMTEDDLRDALCSIRSHLYDIRSTNSFMVMTINRCIDYTKASQGLKLTPKNETVDVLETVSLPLLCMRNVQQKVLIKLSALPVGLCSHIVTDKQLLQENILCLLSNASKYSDGGTVRVTLSFHNDGPANSSSAYFSPVRIIGAPPQITSMLVVEVEDEGIGVPEELVDCLFNPFQQTQQLAGGTVWDCTL